MPYKTEKIPLQDSFLKRSSKLLPCQKEMVVYWSNRGFSQRKLAEMFKVSRRLIQFIINPEKLKSNIEARNARGGSTVYYDRKKHNQAVKSLRKYKQKIFAS